MDCVIKNGSNFNDKCIDKFVRSVFSLVRDGSADKRYGEAGKLVDERSGTLKVPTVYSQCNCWDTKYRDRANWCHGDRQRQPAYQEYSYKLLCNVHLSDMDHESTVREVSSVPQKSALVWIVKKANTTCGIMRHEAPRTHFSHLYKALYVVQHMLFAGHKELIYMANSPALYNSQLGLTFINYRPTSDYLDFRLIHINKRKRSLMQVLKHNLLVMKSLVEGSSDVAQ